MRVDEGDRLLAGCGSRHGSDLGLQRQPLGPDQADRYVDDIHDTCRSLAMEIKRGRVVDVRRGYLKMSSGSHMIYFRDGADGIEVIRVLHGRQDVDRNL